MCIPRFKLLYMTMRDISKEIKQFLAQEAIDCQLLAGKVPSVNQVAHINKYIDIQ